MLLPCKIIVLFFAIANTFVLIIDGHLVIYHIWIQRQGISTFEHIIYKRALREIEAEYNENLISKEQLDEWKKNYNAKKSKPKSKII